MDHAPGEQEKQYRERAEDDLQRGSAPTFDTARYREVLGHFATGVAVVTTADDDGPAGFTCQAFNALSLEPPLVVFAPSRSSNSVCKYAKALRSPNSGVTHRSLRVFGFRISPII